MLDSIVSRSSGLKIVAHDSREFFNSIELDTFTLTHWHILMLCYIWGSEHLDLNIVRMFPAELPTLSILLPRAVSDEAVTTQLAGR